MITKINIRDQVKELLVKAMKSGEMKPNQPLSLAALARELEVSVTPIREALTQLEQTNIIQSLPNKGFVIPELSDTEALDLYELVAELEVLAVRKSSFSKGLISKLKKQQQVFEKTTIGIDRINADMDFHEILTSNSKNMLVLKILSELKIRIFFYEMDFMENQHFYEESENHHQQIIHFLEKNQIENTCNVIKENWMQILKHIK